MAKKQEENLDDLKKGLYKKVLKYIKSEKKDIAREIVNDVIDPNYIAEVDADKIPSHQKENVLNKSKLKKEKGIEKLKRFVKNKKKTNT